MWKQSHSISGFFQFQAEEEESRVGTREKSSLNDRRSFGAIIRYNREPYDRSLGICSTACCRHRRIRRRRRCGHLRIRLVAPRGSREPGDPVSGSCSSCHRRRLRKNVLHRRRRLEGILGTCGLPLGNCSTSLVRVSLRSRRRPYRHHRLHGGP